MWPHPGSCIKASPLMQPVAASPKGDLNTGVLLYIYFMANFDLYLMLIKGDALGIYPQNNPSEVETLLEAMGCTGSETVDVPVFAYKPVQGEYLLYNYELSFNFHYITLELHKHFGTW